MNILTSITAICGVAFGIAGLVLGVLNYLRDRPKIKVHLQWDMELSDEAFRPVGECGLITVTNEGRRPVFISHACLLLPKSFENRLLVIKDSVQGQRLSEGDPPAKFIIPDAVQKKYQEELARIRAQVSDSTGRVYFSKYPKMQRACRLNETN